MTTLADVAVNYGRSQTRTDLTDREVAVMRAIYLQGSTQRAARLLGISVDTVRNHRAMAYAKTATSTAPGFWAVMGWDIATGMASVPQRRWA